MGLNDGLVSDVGTALLTISSSLTSISSLTFCLDAISSLGRRLVCDTDMVRMESIKLEKIEKEVKEAMKMVDERFSNLIAREEKVSRMENELQMREGKLTKTFKKLMVREIQVSERERRINDMESKVQHLVVKAKEEAEKRINKYVEQAPPSIRLNVGKY